MPEYVMIVIMYQHLKKPHHRTVVLFIIIFQNVRI